MPDVVVKECPSVLSRASSEPVPQPSRSPGVLECLQRCASALAIADLRIDSLAKVARKVSGGSSLRESPSSKSTMSGRTRQCHGCHGPCDESHRGYKTGADRCPLEHYDGCEGGIGEGHDRLDQKWRGCPRGYVCIEDDLSDGHDFGSHGFMEDGILGEQCMLNDLSTVDHLSVKGAAASDVSLGAGLSASTGATTVTASVATTSSHLGTAASTTVTGSGIGSTMVTSEAEAVSSQVTAARHRLLMLKKQREDLEILAELRKEEELEAAQTKKLQEQLKLSKKSVRPGVGDAAARLRVRNQPAENQIEDYGFYNGLTIPQIRKVPGLASVVEDRIDQVRSEVPSLSRRPNAPLGGPKQQLGGPKQQLGARERSTSLVRQSGNDVMFDTVRMPRSTFVNDLVVLDDDVPLPRPKAGRQTGKHADLLTADPETDPSDEEDFGQQMRLVYRRDKNGMKYRTWEPVQEEQPRVVYEWVTDERTGRQYKQPVVSERPAHSIGPGLRDHRSSSASNRHARHQHLERAPTFLSLSDSGKEGKSEKKETIVDWARKCPVLWAEKLNFDNMNAVAWLWGFMSEILETKSSNAASLEGGVLEAKLQHALCVLEVCATHSEKTDFDTQGWKIAKLYAHKVQAQLDRGLVTWSDFAEFKANPHPSELIAAKQELEQKLRVRKKPGDEGTGRKGEKLLCTTWNSSKVEGKCDWQVRNPDKGKCNRRHDCSYCLDKGLGNAYHQRSFCAKRISSGET